MIGMCRIGKMKITKIFIGVIALAFSFTLHAQSERKLVRSGNSDYEDGNFSEAEVQYRKALDENPNYFNGKFNLGDAMYRQDNYEESGKLFNELTEANLTDEQKSGAFYNLGNTFLKANKFQESIEAYKKSLRLNPDDYDAKYNLEYARKMLDDQQQNQDQDQDQNQDQNQDKDKQDQQDQDQNKDQDQENKDQQDQQDKQDQKQDQNKSDQSDKKQDQDQQPQPQQISKQDAQRMLDALKNDEKETLQKLQKEKAKAVKGGKTEIDW